MRSIGIDIGSSSIKVVEVFQNNKGLQILHFTEHPISQNPGFDPDLEIIEFLRSLRQTYDPTQVRFVVGLRQDQVAVRNKIFPFNDRNKILKSLPFELEEDLPFSSETAIFDAKIIRSVGQSTELLACAVPKHRVQEMIQKMKDANIEVSVISSEAIAFANCFENWNSPPPSNPNQTVLLEGELRPPRNIQVRLHIGHSRSLVTAFDENSMIGVRSILWGGKNIAEAIARRYEIPFIEALKELQTKGFVLPSREGASYDQIVFSDTISNQLKDLGRDLKMTLLEFESEFNGVVQNITLSGGVSSLLNVHVFLTQITEVPVNLGTVLDRFTGVNVPATQRTDSTIAVALGLAIEGLKKPRNPALNFLKAEFAKQNKKLQELWQQWALTAQVAAAAFVVFWIFAMFRESVAVNLEEKVTEGLKTSAVKVGLSKKMANESGIKRFIQDSRKKNTDLRTISGLANMNSALDILKKINDAAPGKNAIQLTVRRLQVNEAQVEIEGSVGRAQELGLLQSTLKSIATDGRVTSIRQTMGYPAGTVPFAMGFSVDRNIQK